MQVLCDCEKTFEADDALAGQSVHCPHCGLAVRLPATPPPIVADRDMDDPSQDTHAPFEEVQPEADDFALLARLARQKRMRVICGACSKMLAVSRLLAGKKRKCPACGVGIQIPQLPEIDEPAPSQRRPAPPQETLPGADDIKADKILALVSDQDPALQEAYEEDAPADSPSQPVELVGVSWETLIVVSLLALLVGLGAGLAYAHWYWVKPLQATPAPAPAVAPVAVQPVHPQPSGALTTPKPGGTPRPTNGPKTQRPMEKEYAPAATQAV